MSQICAFFVIGLNLVELFCKGLNDALIIHSYNDVINIGQEVEGQYTSICIAVRTCTYV